jgi:MFS transporter, AAHS family, 4-hydroxybenzoate transporter
MSTESQHTPSALSAFIDGRPLSALQIRVFIICSLIVLLDGYDLQAMGLAVPAIAGIWHIAPAAFGPALAASMFGLGLGSAFLAPLGDRLGRRPLLIGGLVVIAATAVGIATSTMMWHLVLWRALIGAALGVCQGNASALTAEYAPLRRRAGLMTLTGCGVAVGAVLAGLTAPWVIEKGGWQGLFIVGGILPLAVGLVALVSLPESIPFLNARDPTDRRIPLLLRKLSPDAVSLRLETGPVVPHAKGTLWSLLAPAYRERTLRLWFIYGLSAMLMYFLMSWLPVFMSSAGWTNAEASRGIALLQFGGIAGALFQAWLVDRQHVIAALTGAYIVTTVSALLFAAPGTRLIWPLLLVLIGSGVAGAMLSLIALGALFYPPPIRVTGFGWAAAISRGGAMLGPLAGGWILARGVPATMIIGLISIPAALCIVGTLGMKHVLREIRL